MSQRTYVILTNTARSGRRDPYSAFLFNSRGIVKRWKEVDLTCDLIFSTAQELADNHDFHTLNGVYRTLCTMEGHTPQNFQSSMEAAKAVFSWATKRAQPYRPTIGVPTVTNAAEKVDNHELDEITDSGLANRAKEAKSQKPAKTPKPEAVLTSKGARVLVHKKYSNDQKITAILTSPPIREGTNRYRNMQVVIDSKTVGEALQKLKELTPPGVPADIDIAVEKKAIVIE